MEEALGAKPGGGLTRGLDGGGCGGVLSLELLIEDVANPGGGFLVADEEVGVVESPAERSFEVAVVAIAAWNPGGVFVVLDFIIIDELVDDASDALEGELEDTIFSAAMYWADVDILESRDARDS